MEGFNQERRGLFDGLKVPFDVKAILLAAAGVLLFIGGSWVIEEFWPLPGVAADRGLLTVIAGNVTVRLGHPIGDWIAGLLQIPNEGIHIPTGTWVFFLTWCAVVWSFFSGAICRIAAMKIAREESIELKDAVKFGFNKFFPNLLSIAFVFAICGFFYFICDATIAGWVGRIPYIGEVLVAILYFLVLLSSFFVVFTAALGLLGFNLSAAAIATEASDTFDGVSRSWNYILARPWHVLLTYGLTFAYILIFLFFGNRFLEVSVKSLGVRWWGMSHEARPIKPPLEKELASTIGIQITDEARLPGKAEYLYKRYVLKDPKWTGSKILYPQLVDGQLQDRDIYPALEGSLKFSGGLIGLWLTLAQVLIWAYAVSYFLSAQTTTYFLLRKEVEGDDYTEINLEDEEDEDDMEYGEIGEQRPMGKPLPTAGISPATPAGGTKPLPLVAGGEKKEEKPGEHKH